MVIFTVTNALFYMKIVHYIFLLIGILAGLLTGTIASAAQGSGRQDGDRQASRTPLPPLPDTLGRSGHFSGFLGRDLIVAGGCNFPEVPAARGGTKRFYADVWRLRGVGDCNGTAGRWEVCRVTLPEPVAYGAAVGTDSALYLVGGANASGALRHFGRLFDRGGRLVYEALEPLPVGIDNGGAALLDSVIYVTAGNQPGSACGLYAYDLRRPGWHRLTDYPNRRRLQPVVAAAAGRLWIIGGYDHDAATNRCHLAGDVLAYSPDAGSWHVAGTLPVDGRGHRRCIVGAAGTVAGDDVLIAGGVNACIFRQAVEGRAGKDYLSHPAAWYRFSDEVLRFHAPSGKWATVPAARHAALARAGGVVVRVGKGCIMVGGETKPGVRSPLLTPFSAE